MSDTYQSILAPSTALFKDRGSKFLAHAFPVISSDEIKHYVQALKKEHPKAVHHCFAWRLGTDGTQFRANDDSEPSGSAGKPILGQIDSFGLTNILVVVVRYFGGTLLGVPGLINAYKTATAEALQQAEIIEKDIEIIYNLQFEYPIMNEVMMVLKQNNVNIIKNKMELFCEAIVGIPLKNKIACLAQLENIYGLTVAPVS